MAGVTASIGCRLSAEHSHKMSLKRSDLRCPFISLFHSRDIQNNN